MFLDEESDKQHLHEQIAVWQVSELVLFSTVLRDFISII